MQATLKISLTPSERRASIALAGLFACRMLGLFLLLPVFAVAAHGLPGGDSPWLVGLALGMYGLTQAVMQIPLGLASDRWGRRPIVIAGLIVFVIGSVVCALADDVLWIMIGRAVQGAGAISAVITAWLADATRSEVRTRAMAMVGGSIGLSFILSLLLSPLLVGWWSLSGLFYFIACLGILSLAVAFWVVPTVPLITKVRTMRAVKPRDVFLHTDLIRLNFGVFMLHFVQMALFVVVPGLLTRLGGLQVSELWKVYLPVILMSFVLMVPVVFITEECKAHRGALRASVAGLIGVCFVLPWASQGFITLAVALTGFFFFFNVLEALQPSLVSRVAPEDLKGLALGFYNTSQAAGLFTGGAVGGWLASHDESISAFCGGLASPTGSKAVFCTWLTSINGPIAVFCVATLLAILWLAATWAFKALA